MSDDTLLVYVGFDPREREAFQVCERSIKKRSSKPVKVMALRLNRLRKWNLYWRKWRYVDGQAPIHVHECDVAERLCRAREFGG